MFSSIELPTNEVTVKPPPTMKKNDRSFRMDRGKIVCNGCGGYFPNLVLFENHTHRDGSIGANLPSKKSGPKTEHKTFNNISHEEMMEAFHKMPELKGCYFKNGQYFCYLCGKGFGNPYVLFSHKIIHPPDMKPVFLKTAPSIQTQTPKVKYFQTKNERVKVVVPSVYENDPEADSDDSTESDEESGFGLPRVTKAVLKVPQETADHVDEALPISFGDEDMVQVPWVPVNELMKRKPGQSRGQTTYIYKMLGSKSERSTYVNINKPNYIKTDSKNIVLVSPNQIKKPWEKTADEKYITNPGNEKGLVFTDLDEEKMKKVFKTLPGLQKCRVLKDGQFQCDRCPRVCENPYLLFSHRLTHRDVLEQHANESTSGPDRKLVFYSLPGLNKCKMVDGEYHCDVCPEKFSNPYLLFTHKMSHDSSEKKNQDVIEIREKSAFGNIFGQNGLAHCKIENGKYFCDRCARVFNNPYLLLNHKLLHEKKDVKKTVATTSCSVQTETEDPESGDSEMVPQDSVEGSDICYECNLCQVQFENLDGLASHIEAHTKDAEGPEATISTIKTEDEGDISGPGRKRPGVETDSTSADDTTWADTPPSAKVIKKEPLRPYPGEETAVQSVSPGTTKRVKIKVELVPPKSDTSHQFEERLNSKIKVEDSLLKVKIPHRKPLKRAVVQIEKLNIKPNQVCILK